MAEPTESPNQPSAEPLPVDESSEYTPDEAELLFLEKLKSTHPSPEVQEVIEEREQELVLADR
jgi:hypothetical protein